MKVVEVRDVREVGDYTYAYCEFEIGRWWWKSTRTREIYKHKYGAFFRWLETGALVPNEVDNHIHAAKAREQGK